MSFPDRRDILKTLAALTVAPLAACNQQAATNNKPVRIIAPIGAGSTGDTVARRFVTGFPKAIGRPAYVENLPGAGGIIGTAQLVKAPKTGDTLAIVTSNHVVNPGIYKKMPFDSLKDITPIAVIGDSPQVLMVNPSLGVKNLQDLIALAKAKPGTVHYGSSGNGTTLHLLGVKLAKSAGIDIVHVPYKGTAPMMSDLLGGQIQIAFAATTVGAPYVKAGKLVAIGITSKARSRLLPEVPTLAEQGLTDFDLSTWMAVIGPAGLDAALVGKLNRAVNETLQQPDEKAWFEQQDWRLMSVTPAEAAAFFAAEQAKYLQLVRDSGAKLQ